MRRKFSERHGHREIRTSIQKDEINEILRNDIWSIIIEVYGDYLFLTKYGEGTSLKKYILMHFFHKPIDSIDYRYEFPQFIRNYYFRMAWYDIYNFIELLVNNSILPYKQEPFIHLINGVLKRNLAAYRLIEGKIVPIVEDSSISAIQSAIEDTRSKNHIQIHLMESLKLLSDKKNPDYRNSIKESVSAVESLVKKLSKNPKTTFGTALTDLEKNKIKLHGALRAGFNSLYGWTSDAQGIRHGLMDEPDLDQEDAIYMLVSCSAFISYLIVKAHKAGIKLVKITKKK